MHHHQRHSLKRPGFTLIEILVTIAIILILAGLALWATQAVIANRYRNNTIATITVVNKMLEDHWRFVIDEAKREAGSTNGISPAVIALAQPDPDGSRAQVLWVKFRLMEAFPQRFDEIVGHGKYPKNAWYPAGKNPFVYSTASPDGTPYIPPTQARYNAGYTAQIQAAVGTKPITQSSACLRIALAVARGGNSLTDDQINFAVLDTDNDGVKEITDSWGRPLAFFRFAWNNAEVQAANPGAPKGAASKGRTAVFADPIDTGGALVNNMWYNGSLMRLSLEENLSFHSIGMPKGWVFTPNTLPLPPQPGPLIDAAYVIPVIASAGPDGKFGYTVVTPGKVASTMPGNPAPSNVDANPEVVQPATGLYIAGGKQIFHPEMSIHTQAQVNDNIVSFKLR